MTSIESYTKMLDKLKEQRKFDELLDYAVYLAQQNIESHRIGRARDRAIEKCVSKRKNAKIFREFLKECSIKDKYYAEEQEFYVHFLPDSICEETESEDK